MSDPAEKARAKKVLIQDAFRISTPIKNAELDSKLHTSKH